MNAFILHLSGFSGWNLTVLEAIGNGASGIKAMGWLGRKPMGFAWAGMAVLASGC